MLEALIEVLNRVAATVTGSLVNTLLVTVAGVIVAVLASRCKGWSAATRYGLWWLILAFTIAAPIVWAAFAGDQSAPANQVSLTPMLAAGGETARASARVQETDAAPSSARPSAAALFLLGWALAAGIQAARVLRGFLYGLRLKRSAAIPDPDLGGLFERIRVQLAIRRPVRMSLSNDISSPAVVGYLSPHVMIPAGLRARLSLREMEQILMHELAHIARYDDWSIAAQRLLEAVAICHPLVRYVAYRLNLDREMASDDRVAETHDRGRYAECLAKVAEMNAFPVARAVLVPLMERKPELLARVEVLLDDTRTHLPHASRRRLLVACAGFILLGAIGLRSPKLVALPAAESYLSPARPQTAQQEQQPPSPPTSDKASERSQPSIDSIVLTFDDGSRSMFGSGSGYSSDTEGREPGTIEFRSGDQTYIIHDKGILAEARKLLQPMEELGRQQSQLGEKQSALGKAQSFLGEQQQKVAEQPLDESMQAKLAHELQALKKRIDELNAKHLGDPANDFQAQLATLQSALAKMQAEMGSVQGKLGQQQGLLGEKQGALGQQQAELGKQQAELGAQQAAESKRVENKLRELIRNAQSRGLANQAR